MTDVNQTAPAPIVTEEPNAVPENPAVARCMSAKESTYKALRANNKDDYDASKAAKQAYRDAMPSLFGYENICNFIACVARGMLIGAICGEDSTKLLYAAQVALATVPRQPTASKRAAK